MSTQHRASLLARVRLVLTCLSIASNALFAGGIFVFPILSPALASHLKLTQPQLTTIVLFGMIGQYPFAAVVGKLIDRYGPWCSSLVSAVLFSTGFGFFAQEISKTPDDITQPSVTSFHRLAVLFFMAGLGTAFSLFSFLFAASKNFPDYIGIASGTSMAIFGLSPLFLSLIASNFFSSPDTGLDVTSFLRFLAVTVGAVHVLGALTLTIHDTPIALQDNPEEPNGSESGDSESSERTPLIPGGKRSNKANVDVQIVPVQDEEGSALDLVRDPYFWVLALVTLCILGTCEMVMSNIGTIVLSLPSSESSTINTVVPSTDVATSTQVRVISLSNTITRLFVGFAADFVSPVASYLPNGSRGFTRKHFISRVAWLSGMSLLLALTFLWTEIGIKTQSSVWPLSIGVGIVYGASFTLLPSIMSSIWGLPNLGRNFGILTYAPFVGTPLFSYLYAFVAASHADGNVCMGTRCWVSTFWVCGAAALTAFVGTLVLWRAWKGRV
ncbi:hypothetical protein PLICRDRAFT_124849 [Plicaturopsis crispa FD-325 SS-3]|nr:hypothetical protein PLICRDRAFT_124849 [Plicaturopsis crispa FD-325 SS-3]